MKRLILSTCLSVMVFSEASAQLTILPKGKSSLGISQSKFMSSSPNPLVCETADRTPVASTQLYSLSTSSNTISKLLACSRAKEFKSFRFSRAACTDASICEEVLVNPVLVPEAYKVLDESLAFDYAKNALAIQSDSMEKMEIMKAFAREKYKDDKIGSSCWPKFAGNPQKGAVCNYHMLEAAYKELQLNCRTGVGCRNRDEGDVLSYESFVEKEKVAATAFVFDYNNYRISTKVKNQIKKDSEYLEKLGKLAVSPEFIKLTPEQKAEKVFEVIGLEPGSRATDPVLSYDFSLGSPDKNILKRSQKFQDLMKVFSQKNLTEKSFKEEFDNFRKQRVSAIFGEGKCNEEPRVSKICHDMTSLSEGKTIQKDALTAEHHTSRNGMNNSDFLKLKEILGEKFTAEDAEVLLNSRRCSGFELFGARIFANEKGENLYAAQAEIIPPSDEYRPKGIGTGVNLFGQAVGSSANDYFDKKEDYIDEGSVTPEPKSYKDYQSEAHVTPGVNPVTGESLQPQTYAANPISDSLNSSYYNNLATRDEEAHKKEKTDGNSSNEESYINSNPSSNSAIEDKISDLEKRLATATEKMAEMKLENETAEAQRASEKKIADENARIKELQSQLETMKAVQRVQNQTASTANRINHRDEGDDSYSRASFSNGQSSSSSGMNSSAPVSRSESVSSKVAGADIRDSKSSNDSNASSAISNNASSNLGAGSITLTGVNNSASESRSITAVDGMSAEKITETITSRILELKGIPFFIEEGGMVKEIIPVLKDGVVQLDEKGNPLYEKIVKGKANDKKFAKLKDKGRAPASITSNADLKRDQEEKLKRERAEYNQLKALTNGVLKKDK